MAASVTSSIIRGSAINKGPELNEQMKKMVEIAEKVVTARNRGEASPEPRQSEVDKIVKSFVDFAEKKTRPPKAEVEQIEREMDLYAPFPDGWSEQMRDQYIKELTKQYLNLSGYTLQDHWIVELNS